MTDPSSRQRGRYKITDLQLSNGNFKEKEKLVRVYVNVSIIFSYLRSMQKSEYFLLFLYKYCKQFVDEGILGSSDFKISTDLDFIR
jgi:hypothetical protein